MLVRRECFWVYLFFSFFSMESLASRVLYLPASVWWEGAVERESCGGGVVESSFLYPRFHYDIIFNVV